MSEKTSGIFIVLDGPDGGGKTTQAEYVEKHLISLGRSVLRTREPGGTPISEAVRGILLNPENTEMSPRAELLLYMAARAQLVDEVIRPALKNGVCVIADRFLLSSIAYQGIASGLGANAVMKAGEIAIDTVIPDITFVLDVPLNVGRSRTQDERDRIEQRPDDYHTQVRNAYLDTSLHHKNTHIIDASKQIDDVANTIREILDNVLE